MKLANFFLMTMLVGTLGVLGCSDDTTNAAGSGGSGTAGTGGGGTDPCTGGFCVDPSEPKTACEVTIEFCKSADCCEGANPTDDQCDAFGTALCTLDFGGAGGAGGAGGTSGGGDNPTADEVCDGHCDSTDPGRIQDCKDTYDACLLNPPSGGDPGEKCSVIGLAQCGEL